ncbi:helix-turn-helix domain-containing protein [Nocardia brasiliensis]|uniref:helix-turn-helix domain-containing protein n=1 Tax=Nocardia brasiliensis TaxID=37326 RepID=UPI001892EDF9|nr:helix-turn-helix domain-containing protein [Nocardia brasiliensis]MBF6547711.1 helix-turn-helix domain-containing protein [Nocardia brasiliensis]
MLRSRRLALAPSIKARTRSSEVWLTTEDLARRFQAPVKTIAVWASTGKGPRYIRVGRYRRYRLSDIDEWKHALLTADRTRRAA